MFKRVIWFAAGAAAGVVAVKKAEAAVAERLERYTPPAVAANLGSKAKSLGSDVRDAVSYGRREMRITEAQLAEEHDPALRNRRSSASTDRQ